MADIAVAATFPSMEQAKSAVSKLQALRVGQLSINRSGMDSSYGEEASDYFGMFPDGDSYTSAVNDGWSVDESLNEDQVNLTALVSQNVHSQTLRVIEQSGGYLHP